MIYCSTSSNEMLNNNLQELDSKRLKTRLERPFKNGQNYIIPLKKLKMRLNKNIIFEMVKISYN